MADRLRIERDTDGLLVLLTAEGFEVAIVQDASLLADLLALLPPEAAAKVAGPWTRSVGGRCRQGTSLHVCRGARGWYVMDVLGVREGTYPTRAEAEAAVDALLVGDGWVLGTGEAAP